MRNRVIARKIMEFPSLDSTNSFCKELLGKKNVHNGTVVWAHHQVKGRGQGKNSWESAEGQNLTFSIIVYPKFLEPSDQFFLSMVVSLGIIDFLKEHTENVFIKWPNDIYIGNKKIAGILIENSIIKNRIEDSILGIGININQTSFSSHIPNPVSLKQITGRTSCLNLFITELCTQINYWYLQIKKGNKTEIKNRYTEQLLWLNEERQFKEQEKIFRGYIRGIDNFGRLAMENEGGLMKYYGLKEVEFLLPLAPH